MPEERAVVTEKMVVSSAPCRREGGPRGSMLTSLFSPHPSAGPLRVSHGPNPTGGGRQGPVLRDGPPHAPSKQNRAENGVGTGQMEKS